MENKMLFLFKESFKKKVCTKWFKWINIILLVVIIGLVNIDSIIKFFGGDFNEEITIYIDDEVKVYDDFVKEINSSYASLFENYNIKIEKVHGNIIDIENKIKDEENSDIIIKLSKSLNYFDAEIISYEYIDNILYQNIYNSLNSVKKNKALIESGIDLELLENVKKDIVLNRTFLNEDLSKDSEKLKMIGSAMTIIFILPFFFLVVIIIQMIGAEINEEKSSKSMEIIISSVSPQTHFLSKIASCNVFALFQGLLLILYTLIGSFIRLLIMGNSNILNINNFDGLGEVGDALVGLLNSDILSTIIRGLPMFIVLSILSFVLYSIFTGILASMTTNMEDYQQLQTPIMIFLMLGYYLAIMSVLYNGSIFTKILSFIPFISGILAPVLYTLGDLSLYHLYIDAGIMLITIVLFYKYGMKIYKVGILNYSSSKLWEKIFKSLKN